MTDHPQPDLETAILTFLCEKLGGHSITIVRKGVGRFQGFSVGRLRSIALRDLIDIFQDYKSQPQCCTCGKKGLSIVEGDGGSECQLSDGRWTCSQECWERAVDPQPVAWRYRYKGGKWMVQKNKPAWYRDDMPDCELEPLVSARAALKGGNA